MKYMLKQVNGMVYKLYINKPVKKKNRLLVNRKKKSFFVMGTLKNNSTPAGDFTGYYMSWVAPFGNWPVALN